MVPDRLLLANKKGALRAPFFARLLGLSVATLWLLTWLDPNHYPPWIVFENEASAFVALLLAVVALHLLRSESGYRAPTRISVAPLLWLTVLGAAIAVQHVLGLATLQQAWLGALYLMAVALAFVGGGLAYAAAAEDRAVWEARAAWGLVLAALLSAVIVLLQYFGMEHLFPIVAAPHGLFRPFGNLGQPNNQATFLVMGVVGLDLLRRRQRVRPVTAALTLFILIPAVVATGSRSGVLGALCAAFYLCVVPTRKENNFTLIWAASLLLLFLCMPAINQFFAQQATRSASEVFSDSARVRLYSGLLQSLTEHPWAGYGFGNTGVAQSQMALLGYVGDPVTNAHNLALEFLVWFGIPLGLILTVSAAAWILYQWRRGPGHHRPLYALLIPFVVHAMVELPYLYSFFLLPSGWVAGYLVAGIPGVRTMGWSARKSFLLGGFVAGVGSLVVYDYLRCADEFTIARFEYRKVGAVPTGHVPYRSIVLSDLQGQLDALRAPVSQDMNSQTIRTLTEQSLRQRIPLAHTKLISYYLITANLSAAEIEIRRFSNLYHLERKALKWGSEDLQNNFCAASEPQNEASPQCKLIRDYFH